MTHSVEAQQQMQHSIMSGLLDTATDCSV